MTKREIIELLREEDQDIVLEPFLRAFLC